MSTDILDNLAKKVSNGDESAFKLLFDHFYPELLHYAHYLVESRLAAEEVVSALQPSILNCQPH